MFRPPVTLSRFRFSSVRMSQSTTPRPLPFYRKRPRRFAPLHPDVPNVHNAPKLRGIVFDVDGTLCLPQNYMFGEMRAALGIPRSIDIIDHIRGLPADEQPAAEAKIRAIESRAMTSQRAQPGLLELMEYLVTRGVRRGLCTRNFVEPVNHLLDAFLSGIEIGPVITRASEGIRPKPSPEGIWSCGEAWRGDWEGEQSASKAAQGPVKVDAHVDVLEVARHELGSGLIMVGDSIDDMKAGWRAGAATVLLVNDENEALAGHEYTDLAIRRLDDLVGVLDRGFVGVE